MPPRLAPETGSGPSNLGQGPIVPNEGIEKLEQGSPKVNLTVNDMPKMGNKAMPVPRYSVLFMSYWKYETYRRRLVQEEVVGIAYIMYGGNMGSLWQFFRKVRDPNDKTATVLEALEYDKRQVLLDKVADVYARFLAVDTEAKRFSDALFGL